MPFTATDYLPYDFANRRHIGPSPAEMAEMFELLAVDSLDQLIDETVPKSIRQEAPLDFGKPKSESELLHHMWQTASKNKVLTSLIGQGYHGTVTPPAIQRNILENPAWYTAYTPYQPEISQGRLEALLNFQTMVSDLTGLEIANASLLDEATAAAEAMTMAQRVAKSKARAFFIDENCHPQNIAVMQTRAASLDIEVIVGAPEQLEADKVFGAIFQYPGTHGHLRDFSAEIAALHEHKGIGIVIADPLALTLLKEPGAMGADIAVGSTQRFGVPVGYGGPHAAYMATRTPISAPCRDESWGSAWTATATVPTASACRPASSISAARRPPRMSAPRRRSWPSWRRCMRCSTVPRVCAPSRSASTARPCDWPRGWRRRAFTWNPRLSLTRLRWMSAFCSAACCSRRCARV